jgi:opacity protein-like surface antigen
LAVNSSSAAAVLLICLAGLGSAAGAEMCEDCWEIGGRGIFLHPSSDAGTDPTFGIGVNGLYRFRPYWSVEVAYDRHPGSIPDGPDETVTFLTVTGSFTFQAAKDLRTRAYLLLGAGLAHDHVSSFETRVTTPSGVVRASSDAASDNGTAYVLGAGGLTSLKKKLWLRYEARWVQWSTFDIDQGALQIMVGVTYKISGL